MLPMVVADSRDSHDDACVADKSQHFGSNGSSKQHDVEQMPARLADAFVHKPSHRVPVSWRLADEPHVVIASDSPTVDVYVSFVAATSVDCRPDAVERDDKSDADSCWLACPSSPLAG